MKTCFFQGKFEIHMEIFNKLIDNSSMRDKLHFLNFFSHELKTPLSSIKLSAELLKSSSLDEKQKHLVSRIDKDINELVNFISQVLDGNLDKSLIQPTWSKGMPFLKTLTESFELLCQRYQVDLKWESQVQESREVFMDVLWIKQVLSDLISNALENSKKNSSVFLTVNCVSNNVVRFSVSNQVGKPTQGSIFAHQNLGLKIIDSILSLHKSKLESERQGEVQTYFFDLNQVR